MSPTRVDRRPLRAAIVFYAAASAACGLAGPAPQAPSEPVAAPPAGPIGALSGTLRFTGGQPVDTAMGPVVVMLAPLDVSVRARPMQQFRIVSRGDRFDPGFTTVAEGDFIVFVNEGAVSHRFFSASLGADVQIPVGPQGSSPPQRVEREGEHRFFCSLHPDEHFNVLVTGDVFTAVVSADGRFYIAPIPEGSYYLSVWGGGVEVPIRTVRVEGPYVTETIVLDPSLIRL
jgi:plastocyanin